MLDVNFIYPRTKRDHNGTTALHQAVFQNKLDIVNLLIDRGADPNIGDENVWTPLYWAVERRRIDMVKLLLNRGADPNKMSNHWTPLHRAVQNDCKFTVQLLLDKGALPNIPWVKIRGGVRAITAIDLAERRGNDEIIQLLHDHSRRGWCAIA